jgi:hypothetical protein
LKSESIESIRNLKLLINLQRKIRDFLKRPKIRQISQLNYENTLQDNKNINTEINGGPRHRANQSSLKFKSDLYQSILNKNNDSLRGLNNTNNPQIIQQYVKDFRYQNASYTGDLLDGMRHGKGVQIWDDGAKYDGEWKFDQANGYGTFYYVDGDIYQGQWENDKANGEGTYFNIDGATYQGEWKDDLQDGYGIEQWNDESSYKGYYKNGMKTGYGVYIWADRSKYEGYWKENKQNGNVRIL